MVTLVGSAHANTLATTNSEGSLGIHLVPEHGSSEPPSPYITNRIAPGATAVRKLMVSNSTSAPVQVELYAAGATVKGSTFAFANGHTPDSASSYTEVSPARATVAQRTTIAVTVTIRVPSDAPAGAEYAVVWAEARSRAAGSNGIAQVNRVGIREYLSIGAGGLAAPDFTLGELSASNTPDGRRLVQSIVHNTGGRALDLSGELRLGAGPGATRAGPFNAVMPEVLSPGASAAVSVILPAAIQAGPWTVLLTARASGQSHSASARLTFPGENSMPHHPSLWWWWLLLPLAALAFAAAWALKRRDRQAL